MNYYDILEISPTASDEIIKSAYKALARKYHPDVYVGSQEEADRRMKMINEAYSVLSDPEKRQVYDSFLKSQRRKNDEKATANSSSKAPPPTYENTVHTSSNRATSQEKRARKGCLSRLFSFASVIFLIFMVRGCIQSDSIPHKTESASSSQSPTTLEGAVSDTSNPAGEQVIEQSRYPFDDEWDNTVQAALDSAASEFDYEKKLEYYTGALYLQCMELSFKYRVYEELGGKKVEKQEFVKSQGAGISETLGLMKDTFGEDVVNEVYYYIQSECLDWIDERVRDITANLQKAINVKNASMDDLWELYLSANGGVDAFYS